MLKNIIVLRKLFIEWPCTFILGFAYSDCGGIIMYSEILQFVMEHLLYFALHINSAGSFPKPLSAKEERECLQLVKQGDVEAKNRFIEHNLRLVAHIIKKYYSKQRDQEDLISIGTIGLIKAVGSFDVDKGTRFATYAARCIDNEILMYFRNLKKSAQDVYISDSIDTDKEGNSLTLMDIVSDDESVADSIELKIKSEKLRALIDEHLDEREKLIIELRYGLNGKKPLTQREVASILDISRSYVSRIEKKALSILNKNFDMF